MADRKALSNLVTSTRSTPPLRACSNSSSQTNDVNTSELLEETNPELEKYLSLRDREELHAQAADLIFILLVSENQVTGPEAEILSFAYDKRLRDKMWVILPKNWNKAGYLAAAVSDFPEERKRQYIFPQIRDCKMIRSFCDEKIRELRGQRFMELQRVRGMLS